MPTPSTKPEGAPPPDLHHLAEAEAGAAMTYLILTMAYVVVGLSFIVAPMVIHLPEAELPTTLRIGGTLMAALGSFPSTKYLQRKDRAAGLRELSRSYERLRISGDVDTPTWRALNKLYLKYLERILSR